MTTKITWTPELENIVIQYKTVVKQRYPDLPKLEYKDQQRTPNALLLGLMALVQGKLREGQVVTATAVYQKYRRIHAREEEPVVPANKRSRDEEQAPAVEPVNKQSCYGHEYAKTGTDFEDADLELILTWVRENPTDTAGYRSQSLAFLELARTVERAPRPLSMWIDMYRRKNGVEPAQQQEPAASTCNEYPKSGTAISTTDRMLLRTWARNNLTDLAGKGSMSPAFMQLVRAMQRPPKGISYMVAEYRRVNGIGAPQAQAVSETRATTGGKRLTRARSQSPVPSYGSSRSSSSSSEDERPTTGGKGPRFLEENRQAAEVSSTRDVAPRWIADWDEGDYAVLRQWKMDHPDYQQSRKRPSTEFRALATSLGRTPRATWDRCYGAVKQHLVGHKRQMTQPQTVQKPAEDEALEAQVVHGHKFKVGDKVMAQYGMGKQWFDATIERVTIDAYFVAWDDGDQNDTYKTCEQVRARASANKPAARVPPKARVLETSDVSDTEMPDAVAEEQHEAPPPVDADAEMPAAVPEVPAALAVLPVDVQEPNVEWWMTPNGVPPVEQVEALESDIVNQLLAWVRAQPTAAPVEQQQQKDAGYDAGYDSGYDSGSSGLSACSMTSQDIANQLDQPVNSRKTGELVWPSRFYTAPPPVRVMSPSNGAAATQPTAKAAATAGRAESVLVPEGSMTVEYLKEYFKAEHDVLPRYARRAGLFHNGLREMEAAGVISTSMDGDEVSLFGCTKIVVHDIKEWRVALTRVTIDAGWKQDKKLDQSMYTTFNNLGFQGNRGARDIDLWEKCGSPDLHLMYGSFTFSREFLNRKRNKFVGQHPHKQKKRR